MCGGGGNTSAPPSTPPTTFSPVPTPSAQADQGRRAAIATSKKSLGAGDDAGATYGNSLTQS